MVIYAIMTLQLIFSNYNSNEKFTSLILPAISIVSGHCIGGYRIGDGWRTPGCLQSTAINGSARRYARLRLGMFSNRGY